MAFDNRRLARRGGDPLAGKRETGMPSFKEAVEKTIEATRPRWRKGGPTESIWRRTLEKHAFPAFGDKPVNAITCEDVLNVVTPIWSSKPEVAKRTRQFTRAALSWAQAHGFVETNVAGEAITGALPAVTAVREKRRALPYQEVAAALKTVDASGASMAVKLCFCLVVLTSVRPGEARLAAWSEVDLDARTWKIPAARMKGGVEHRVPLSDAGMAVMEQARMLGDGSGLLFPSPLKWGAAAVQHDVDQAVEGYRARGEMRSARIPKQFFATGARRRVSRGKSPKQRSLTSAAVSRALTSGQTYSSDAAGS